MTRDDLPVIPNETGCYLFQDEAGRALYVGKAVNLRSRVNSYFGANAGSKALHIVRQARELEYIVTKSESEALLLESNLIKRHKPHFNVFLKDDKSYPFLKLSNEPYPMLEFTRLVKKDGARYFGPYPSAGAVRKVQDLIASIFPLRQNSGSPMQSRKKPCLRFHMGRCLAPCVDYTTPEEYAKVVEQVRAFLEGRVDEVVDALHADMNAAAERQDFELAGVYRDRIEALRRVTGYDSNVTHSNGGDLDFLGFAQAGNYAMVQLFQMRRGRVVGRDKRLLTNAEGATPGEILERFMAEYYSQATHIPPLILVPDSDMDLVFWQQLFLERSGRRVEVRVPRRGDKLELLAMAGRNARTGVETELALLERRGEAPGVTELQQLAGLDSAPWRIEGYDVSNLMGTHTVGSIVVFEGGRAKKSEYRRLRVREVDNADDFEAMRRLVSRRFGGTLADKLAIPDLLLIDGGLGQVRAAREGLEEAGVEIPILGLAKKRETLFRENGKSIIVPETHPALKLLIHVRNEAHRVAVGYNRKRRTASMTRSVLDDVPGIGPKRRDALLAHFSSIDQLRAAELDEIASIPGVGRAAAEAVKSYFAVGG